MERIASLDTTQVDRLRRAYITSVEALVGQMEADPGAIESLLKINRPEFRNLLAAAEKVLPTDTRNEFSKRSHKRYSYGALNPHQD